MSLAYQNNDEAALAYLLDSGEERSGVSYCSYLMLDAILREDAARAQKAGLKTDFKLRLGGMSGFSLADTGVMPDTVLSLLSEDHPGTPDVLRLRVQEWGDALVLTAGRRNFLYALPEEKMNVLRQLTEDYNGWLELTEKGMGIRLFAVLFRPAEK